MDTYRRRISNIRIIDGDTFRADVDLGYYTVVIVQTFRLKGINAYETTRRGDWDKKLSKKEVDEHLRLGKLAKEYVSDAVDNAENIWVESSKDKGKYGRWLGVLYCDDMNVNDALVDNGLAWRQEY